MFDNKQNLLISDDKPRKSHILQQSKNLLD